VSSGSSEEFGQYVVYEELGLGGMATVHRAEKRGVAGFRKPVALKRLHPYLCATPEIVQAFVREAQLASYLHHKNIAQTFELGKVDDVYFIAMEYIPGPTLTQILRQCRDAAGAIPVPVTLGILTQICDALDYAHGRADDQTGKPLGIIHRDVSPPNIIVSNTGIVKLFDFGIAKVQGSDVNTQPGYVIKGKFNYIAPEYLGGKLDLRADLFAVGVIAHELLTGRRLFDGADDFETSTQVLQMPIQPPSRWSSQVSVELDHIVLTALQRDPDLRWRSASALRTALANIGSGANAVASHQQIFDWIEWAYTQKPRGKDTGLERVIGDLEQPSTGTRELTEAQRQELDAIEHEPFPGVAHASTLLPTPGHSTQVFAGLDPPSSSGSRPRLAYPKHKPSIPMSAKPAKVRPSGASVRQPDGGFVDEDVPAKPRAIGRLLLYLMLIVIAAGGGVVAASYLLGLELPFAT